MSVVTVRITFFVAYFAALLLFFCYALYFRRHCTKKGRKMPLSGAVRAAYPVRCIIGFVVWLPASFFAMHSAPSELLSGAIILAVSFLFMSLVLDLLLFVLIKHPLSLGPREFYIGLAPFSFLCYLPPVLGPFLAALILM